MTDVSNLTAVINVPSCSQQTHSSDYSSVDASNFTPDHGDYYRGKLPVMLPGAIIGVLCLIAAFLFLFWLLALCCRPRTSWKSSKTKLWAPGTTKPEKKAASGRLAVSLLILVLTVGVVGVGTWGLTDSIKNTNHQVDTAWGIVATAKSTVTGVTDIATTIFSLLDQLSNTLVTTSKVLTGLGDTVPILSGISSLTNEATSLNSSAVTLANDARSGRNAVARINSQGVDRITSVQDRYQHKTQVAWNPWRPLVFAVLFGLLMLFAVVAGCTVVTGRFPRTAAAFTWLLWIMTAIFMILGAGGLNGAFHIASDTCLYAETFVLNTAARDSNNNNRTMQALDYYFGQTELAADQVPIQIYGINTTELTTALNSNAARLLIAYLDTAAGQAFVTNTSGLNSTEQNQILTLPTTLNQINVSITALTNAVQVSAISPIYQSAKQLVCCQVSDVLHRVWVAWVATASLAAALAIVATIKVFSFVGPVSRGEYYTQQPTDSAAPGRGSLPSRAPYAPGQYSRGQYTPGQFIKSASDAKPSAPPL